MGDTTRSASETHVEAAGDVALLERSQLERALSLPRRLRNRDVLVFDVWEGGGSAFEIKWHAGEPTVRASLPLPDLLAERGLGDPSNALLLHQALISHGITTREVILILPDAVVKHTELTLPKLPRRALLTVLDQKARELDGVGDGEIEWGYRLTDRPAGNQRDVLLLGASRAALLRIIRGLAGVGLATVAIVPAIAAVMKIASCFLPLCADDAFALVLLEHDRARLSLVKGQHLYYDRCARLGEGADGQRAALMRQVHRALLNYQQHHHEDPVRQLFIADRDLPRARQLADDLVGDLLTPVKLLNPAWLYRGDGLLGADGCANGHLIGALLLLGDRGFRAADLLPRTERTRKRDRLMMLIVLCVALFTWAATWWFSRRLQDDLMIARQIANLQRQEIKALSDVPRKHQAMVAMRKRVRSEADTLHAVLPGNMDFGAFFDLVATVMSSELVVTTLRLDAHSEPLPRTGADDACQYAMTLQGLCPRKYLESQSLVQESMNRLAASPLMVSVTPGPLQLANDPQFGPVTRFEIRGVIAPIATRQIQEQ